MQVLQAGPGSSAALGVAPSPVPCVQASSCLCPAPLKSERLQVMAAHFSFFFIFQLVQLQACAPSTPAADFKTFYNNYWFSCRHFSIFVFQSSPSISCADSADDMAEIPLALLDSDLYSASLLNNSRQSPNQGSR